MRIVTSNYIKYKRLYVLCFRFGHFSRIYVNILFNELSFCLYSVNFQTSSTRKIVLKSPEKAPRLKFQKQYSNFRIENMNFQMFYSVVFIIFLAQCNAVRLGGKGNLRGLLTRASVLLPRQMKTLRKQLYMAQKQKHGRLALITNI